MSTASNGFDGWIGRCWGVAMREGQVSSAAEQPDTHHRLRRIALAAAGIVALVLAWMLWSGVLNREPSYDGKPLSEWIVQLEDPDELQRVRAIRAIESLAPKAAAALPALHNAFRDPEISVRRLAVFAYGHVAGTEHDLFPLIEFIKNEPDARLRSSAVLALRWGDKAAIPAVIEAFDDPEVSVRLSAIRVLEDMGFADTDGAIPALRAALQHPNPEISGRAKLIIQAIEKKTPRQ
jgi:hypothetical protein